MASVGGLGRAKAVLGIRNLVLGIHDPAFPSIPDEDVGHGSPYSAGGLAFLELASALGFDGVQLGPQGLTGAGNPSPYDGTLFSRNPLSIALAPLTTAAWGRLLPARTLERIVAGRPGAPDRVAYGHARREVARALAEAWASLRRDWTRGMRAELRQRFDLFRREAELLERDALYAALVEQHGGAAWREWRDASGAPHPDQLLYGGDEAPSRERRHTVLRAHADRIEAYLFTQMLAREQHRARRESARALGLRLWGDLQVGLSQADEWAHRDILLESYRMGAPPSRTNPEGQPWGYPVLDPRLCGSQPGQAPGPGLLFVSARLERAFEDYDGVRIDHPHGLVCPWVYQAGEADAGRAVREGARLHESPDLPEHPELARFARVRPEQIRRDRPRHADDWVGGLTAEQVRLYSVQLDAVLAAARRHGRGPEDVACEVLSTCPEPLRQVLDHHGLGRFRVTQKVGLENPHDVYRSENARPQDWILLGSHDTPTIWQVAERWIREGRAERHAAYLADRLLPPGAPRGAWIARVASDPRELAQAKFAELFVGPATNVMVFFTDLFGLRAPYNEPGTRNESNWSARLGPGFREDYAERRARGGALDVQRALATAIRARGEAFAEAHAPLLAELEAPAGEAPRP